MSVKIVKYEPKYKDAYVSITRNWVEKFFKMEEADWKALNKVEEYIIKPGGMIFLAVDEKTDEALGCCGIMCHIKNGEKRYEFTKLGVKETAQRRGVGWMLCIACLQYAKDQGAPYVFLESNRSLAPSITLYFRVGFKEFPLVNPSYERADIYLEFDFRTTPIPPMIRGRSKL
ncbi:Acetyltransferase (GNAT) family/Acetyltransferase (GNAT) domain containing protein, putative [Angomonas deanei]|uniref:Acetyltransferase (GNAT) family/Acetyltransferase (GNAT) domain containing protein, putative n=1 Tax=Angomonas deanei TaxID=59799 RepID=A0A7G2C759_9TRYP|nr:Acetyltransferase (GNAT) family/Acetyltransferase (GNAT) domain containing protein, putative [Angomonas deanei]